MKTFLLSLSMLVSASSALADHPDQTYTLYHCRTSPLIADGGFNVKVLTGGIVGRTQVVVAENNIMGEILLGRVFVNTERSERFTHYRGKDLELTILHPETIADRTHRAELEAHLIGEVGGASLNEKLVCNPAMVPRPPVTCMAYWEGYVFNEATGSCVRKGRSGCSNPFEHKTLESCEAEFLK